MAEIKTYKCDVCGEVKKDSNGWFRAHASKGMGYVFVFDWDVEFDSEDVTFLCEAGHELEMKHLCSESCTTKLMSRTIGHGTEASSTQENVPDA